MTDARGRFGPLVSNHSNYIKKHLWPMLPQKEVAQESQTERQQVLQAGALLSCSSSLLQWLQKRCQPQEPLLPQGTKPQMAHTALGSPR